MRRRRGRTWADCKSPPTSTANEHDHVHPSAQQLSGRIIDAAVPTDSRQQAAIDRILSSVREAIEPTVRSYADEIVQTATAELRREADLATADLRAALQRQELARIDAESQVADLRRQLEAQKQAADEERTALEAERASQQRRADAEI